MISIIIPTKDGGDPLRRALEAVARQRMGEEVEVVAVDSGSRDGSAELCESMGARVERILPEEFDHGATRNMAVGLARGETLVFLSQDAIPEGEGWLAALVAPLAAEPEVAGVYARQLPDERAKPPERYFLEFLYGSSPRRQRAAGPEDLTLETTMFSNVSSAIRRSLWEEAGGFAEDIVMSEDQDWARRVLLAGHVIAYEPAAAVRHSHRYTIGAAFRRFFDSGVSAERAYLAGERPASAALRRAALRYARGEASWLVRNGYAHWLPYAAAYEFAKLAGLQIGARHRRLPGWLKLRLTMNRAWWSGRGADPYVD
ncbi:MAG TPA: glycosyltransferase [Thermoleophilaceae bacterium]|nr:glycosyltransferase [Thermoleophilaceae bacterium]